MVAVLVIIMVACLLAAGVGLVAYVWRSTKLFQASSTQRGIDETRCQVAQIFAAASERMQRRAGYGDPFGLGRRDQW